MDMGTWMMQDMLAIPRAARNISKDQMPDSGMNASIIQSCIFHRLCLGERTLKLELKGSYIYIYLLDLFGIPFEFKYKALPLMRAFNGRLYRGSRRRALIALMEALQILGMVPLDGHQGKALFVVSTHLKASITRRSR